MIFGINGDTELLRDFDTAILVPLIALGLVAMIPVLVGVVLTAALASRLGTIGVWIGVAVILAATSLWSGLQSTSHGPDQFMTPVAVYGPAMLLAAAALIRLKNYRPRFVLALSVGLAVANLAIAPFAFMSGCAASLWHCP